MILSRLGVNPETGQRNSPATEPGWSARTTGELSPEESEAELERLQKLIEGRKKIAWNTDIAHHLWDLYKTLFPHVNPNSSDRYVFEREWQDIKILQANSHEGVTQFEFELKGVRYKFVDNEERQSWRSLTKIFSLFLYDESGRCLIEMPMKMILTDSGRHYSILPGGPKAFLLGDWISHFISVKLKNQRIRNQEIRAQKHQEVLAEIEDLKNKFGIAD